MATKYLPTKTFCIVFPTSLPQSMARLKVCLFHNSLETKNPWATQVASHIYSEFLVLALYADGMGCPNS